MPHIIFFCFRQQSATTVRSSMLQHLSLAAVTTFLNEKFEMLNLLFQVLDVEGVEQSGDAPELPRGLHCEESPELY